MSDGAGVIGNGCEMESIFGGVALGLERCGLELLSVGDGASGRRGSG